MVYFIARNSPGYSNPNPRRGYFLKVCLHPKAPLKVWGALWLDYSVATTALLLLLCCCCCSSVVLYPFLRGLLSACAAHHRVDVKQHNFPGHHIVAGIRIASFTTARSLVDNVCRVESAWHGSHTSKGCWRYTKLCWVGKHVPDTSIYYHETVELPNPRLTQPKKK